MRHVRVRAASMRIARLAHKETLNHPSSSSPTLRLTVFIRGAREPRDFLRKILYCLSVRAFPLIGL